jgi:hypothetical protein
MDAKFRTFKQRQYVALASVLAGAILIYSGSISLQIFGGVLLAGGLGYRVFQLFFQKELSRKARQFDNDIRNEIKRERQNESKTERDVRKIKFILMCISASLGFFLLAIAYTFYASS